MRFHAVLHGAECELLFGCCVVAGDTGKARERVKDFLRKEGQEEMLSSAIISLVEMGACNDPSMTVLDEDDADA